VFQVPHVGLSEVSLAPGPLGVSLREVHHLLEFWVLLSEGLHPLYQLAPVLSSLSYPLKIHNDNDGIQSPTSKMNTQDSVLTSICLLLR